MTFSVTTTGHTDADKHDEVIAAFAQAAVDLKAAVEAVGGTIGFTATFGERGSVDLLATATELDLTAHDRE